MNATEAFSQGIYPEEKTPETQRQTVAPISATIYHNGSQSSQGHGGVHYYHTNSGSFSQTSQYSPAPFNSQNTKILSSGATSPLRPTPEQITLSNTSHFNKQLSFDWSSVLKSLDLFYRDRQIKLSHTIS